MIAKRILIGAMMGAGIIAGGLQIHRYQTATPEEILGLAPSDPALCQVPGAGGWTSKLLFKLAFADETRPARSETKPFDYVQEGVSPVAGADATLWPDLGRLGYRITTANPTAQRFFDQGLNLAYGFNHAEALRHFRTAQANDPECAMCYWGEAYVLGPHINAPMDPSAVEPALKAIAKARALAHNASAREQALIAAMSARYSADTKADRGQLNAAYADGMTKAWKAFPEDTEIGAMFAEAIMNLSPWDYWQAGGTQPKGRMGEAISAIEKVLRLNPDHPGAIHFYIHAVEASTSPKRAEPYANRLAQLVPGVGHMVHMPSHIYYRVGRYLDALESNREAVRVDEAYFARVKTEGIYPLAYYPHNVHFLMSAAQLAGDGPTVIESAAKIEQVIPTAIAEAVPPVQPMKASQYFALVQFGTAEQILALPDPGVKMPYMQAMWHYARGIAQLRRGDLLGARAEKANIDALQSADLTPLTNWGVPAPAVLQIAALVLDGRIAQSERDLPRAAAHFKAAVALQDNLPYMEPPFWYYPVRQSLGAVLLQTGDMAGAEAAFRESLARTPNSGWSLYGLQEVYRKKGDQRAIDATEALLAKTWIGGRGQLQLANL